MTRVLSIYMMFHICIKKESFTNYKSVLLETFTMRGEDMGRVTVKRLKGVGPSYDTIKGGVAISSDLSCM